MAELSEVLQVDSQNPTYQGLYKQQGSTTDKENPVYKARKERNDMEMGLIKGATALEQQGVPNAVKKLKNYLHQKRQGKDVPEGYLEGMIYNSGAKNAEDIDMREYADKILAKDGEIHNIKQTYQDTSFEPSPLAKEWNTYGQQQQSKQQAQPQQPKAQQQPAPVVNTTKQMPTKSNPNPQNTQADEREVELKKLEKALNSAGDGYRQLKDDYFKEPDEMKRQERLKKLAEARGLNPEIADKYIKGAVRAYQIRKDKGMIDVNGNPIQQSATTPTPVHKKQKAQDKQAKPQPKKQDDVVSNRESFLNNFLG